MKIKSIQTPMWFRKLQYLLVLLFLLIFLDIKIIHQFLIWLYQVLGYLVVALLIYFHLVYHEHSHYFTATLYGYKAKVDLNRKVCEFDQEEKIKPFHIFMIAIMPFLVDLALIKIIILMIPTILLCFVFILIFMVVSLGSSMSDFYLAFSSIRYFFNKNYYFKYVSPSHFELHKIV